MKVIYTAVVSLLLSGASMMTLSGCALLYEGANEVAQGVGEGVGYYCNNTDVFVREQFGTLVNSYAQPNSITVTCINGYRLDSAPLFPPLPSPVSP